MERRCTGTTEMKPCHIEPFTHAPCATLREQSLDPNWKPEGPYVHRPNGVPPSPDFIEAMAAAGSAAYIVREWEACSHSELPGDLLHAFIDAAAHCCKRNRLVCLNMLNDLALLDTLDTSALVKLSTIASDIGHDELAQRLLERAKGTPLRSVFYYNLIRTATETAPADKVDMAFAMAVCEEMAEHHVPHFAGSLRFLMCGAMRIRPTPVDFVLSLMDYRLRSDHDVEPCLLHQFFSVLESLPGERVDKAISYLNNMNSELLTKCIKPVCPAIISPFLQQHCVPGAPCPPVVTYFIVDPFSMAPIDITQLQSIPDSYIVMLFSSARFLAEKVWFAPEGHPLKEKASFVQSLFGGSLKNTLVLPLAIELSKRKCAVQLARTSFSSSAANDDQRGAAACIG